MVSENKYAWPTALARGWWRMRTPDVSAVLSAWKVTQNVVGTPLVSAVSEVVERAIVVTEPADA